MATKRCSHGEAVPNAPAVLVFEIFDVFDTAAVLIFEIFDVFDTAAPAGGLRLRALARPRQPRKSN